MINPLHTKNLQQKNDQCIPVKCSAGGGKRQVTQGGPLVKQEFKKQPEPDSDESENFARTDMAGFLNGFGSKEVDVPCIKVFIDEFAFPDPLAHQRGIMNRWRQMKEKQDSRFLFFHDFWFVFNRITGLDRPPFERLFY